MCYVLADGGGARRPDHCDGTYDAYCDAARAPANVSAVLAAAGRRSLLAAMRAHWKAAHGDDEALWAHEWAKHGTCISTLRPQCYRAGAGAGADVADYFERAVALWAALPSFEVRLLHALPCCAASAAGLTRALQWLAAANITPSASTTYARAAIQAALSARRSGVPVTLRCDRGALKEIWYHFDVRGSVQTGEFVPAAPDGFKSSCPETGVRYLPKKHGGGETTTTTSTIAAPTSTAAPFVGRGHLAVQLASASDSRDSSTGCLISRGTWYASGTCATFTATPDASTPNASAAHAASFALTSSKGPCGLVDAAFVCGYHVDGTQTIFTNVGGNLSVRGSGQDTAWAADAVPSGIDQESVYFGNSGELLGHEVGIRIVWRAL